ncbi:MAG: threonine/serine exporter family protein, partial [Aeoliella sp.]
GEPLAVQLVALSLGVSAIAFAVLFQAKLKDAGWILLAISTAYYGTRLGGAIFAPEAAAWTGAFLLGVVSNLFGRFANRPPAVMLVPGLLLLVPGSLGFFTITALLRQDVQHGIEAAFTMALIAASIVAGLLMANVFVASRRSPRLSGFTE